MKLVEKKEKQTEGNNIIVSRLKKLDSIKLKLTLSPKTNLSRMQDLGGCRIIVKNIKKLNAFVSRIDKFHTGFEFIKKDDYIRHPKKSGYRGVHLIYKLKTNNKDNYKILLELQARTELEHIWSTAVETVGFFTNESLKSSQGENFWKQFFILVSKLFEYEETGKITDYKGSIQEVVKDLKIHNRKYNCISKIAGYKAGVDIIGDKINSEQEGYFLLILDLEKYKIQIDWYSMQQIINAQMNYLKIEALNQPNINAVLVSAVTIKELKYGYNNYFVDTEMFIEKYNELIRKHK